MTPGGRHANLKKNQLTKGGVALQIVSITTLFKCTNSSGVGGCVVWSLLLAALKIISDWPRVTMNLMILCEFSFFLCAYGLGYSAQHPNSAKRDPPKLRNKILSWYGLM